jgi:tetratricopeptide (TPR) repeat protein
MKMANAGKTYTRWWQISLKDTAKISQMHDKVDNSEAYARVSWVVENGDRGFFFVTAQPAQQRKLAKLYETTNSAIYDCAVVGKPFSYAHLSGWAEENAERNIYFIINMDVALRDEEKIGALNMSRDMLMNTGKMWFFCMTANLAERISDFARDFYSYVRMKIRFQAEEQEEFEGKNIMDVEEHHNVAQIKETLERYKDLEARYMAMSFEKNTENELLSAAVALSDIAVLYRKCAEYDNALTLLEWIKEIREKILGEQNPDTAQTYSDIGFIYEDLGDYSKALDWYQKALSIQEKVLGGEHPYIATSYNNIGLVYHKQGDYSTALEWYQKALSIREKVLGGEHPGTATSYNNIGGVYYKQGDYSKALEWYQKALSILEKVLGGEHPNTASSYSNIGVIYLNQGDYNKALECYQKALSIREKVLGDEHPNTANSYNNIGYIYYNQGDYNKALELYQKALSTFEKVLGKDHPRTKITKKNIQLLGISEN